MKQLKYISTLILAFMLVTVLGCASTPKQEGTSEYIDDSTITTKVKAAVFNEPSLKSSEINVETFKGVVQLSGFVNSDADIKKAVVVARSVKGVTSVKNDMRLKSGTGEYVDDTVITTKVKAAIFNEPSLKSSEINVETSNGVVQLSGFVNSEADIKKAVDVARWVKGVTSVKNDMRVKGQ